MSELKNYTVTFEPVERLCYTYTVEAKDEDGAYKDAHDQLQWAIGWDSAKDWEMSGCVEEKKAVVSITREDSSDE